LKSTVTLKQRLRPHKVIETGNIETAYDSY